MNRIIPSVCIALAFAVSLGAQSTSQYPSEQPQSQKMSSGDSVSLTGCLREGDTPGTYVLTDLDSSALRELGAEPSGTAGTTGAPGAAAGSAAGSKDIKVQLSPQATVDLKEHVGQQVSVTGMLDKAAGATGTTGAPGAGSSMGDKDAHKLNVKSVKMVSSTCPPKM
jgi:hypothetical protein